MAGIGHNNGPTLQPGFTYRKHLWTKAKRDLVPTLPLVVIRRRVARAKELGLDYKTYAGVRATSGRDLVAFLFSSSALEVNRAQVRMPERKSAKLELLTACERLALVTVPDGVARANPVLDAVALAPGLSQSWSEVRERVEAFLQEQKLPKGGVLVVGDGWVEREWSVAGRTAGFLASDTYFGAVA